MSSILFNFIFLIYFLYNKMPTLNDLTIKQLKSLAKSYEFTGYSKLNKSDFIDFIENHTNQLGFGQKKHKKKFLRREERRKNKKE